MSSFCIIFSGKSTERNGKQYHSCFNTNYIYIHVHSFKKLALIHIKIIHVYCNSHKMLANETCQKDFFDEVLNSS